MSQPRTMRRGMTSGRMRTIKKKGAARFMSWAVRCRRVSWALLRANPESSRRWSSVVKRTFLYSCLSPEKSWTAVSLAFLKNPKAPPVVADAGGVGVEEDAKESL